MLHRRVDRLFDEGVGRRATLTGRNPLLLSGVVLAGVNGEKNSKTRGHSALGILTAEEVIDLDLRKTELVVLSACETGLGEVAGGEGVFGLQSAFRTAGAASVVASLWKVDDDATRALMVEFYRNLWERKLGKLESLRRAQLTMLRTYKPKPGQARGLKLTSKPGQGRDGPSHPFFWAGFTLNGHYR